MNTFQKRVYQPGYMLKDLGYVGARIFSVFGVYFSGRIPWPMIEKIMLSVTAVNDCTHCSRFHSTLARVSGVEQEEISKIMSMDIDRDVDAYETTALTYAQHYAETERNPTPEALGNLFAYYGEEKASDISLIIRMILIGNLSGNTYDAFFSRLKGAKAEKGNILLEFILVVIATPFIILVTLFSFWKEHQMDHRQESDTSVMNKVLQNISKWIPLGKVPEITSRELSSNLEDGESDIQILDVRTRLEWKNGHIAGALNVPITQLNSEIDKLTFDKDKPVVTICLSAHRSIPAVRALKEAGYKNVKQLGGGMRGWNKSYRNTLVKV